MKPATIARFVATFIATFVAGSVLTIRLVAGPPANAPHVPILLELFTSEGCSSCPPADKVLEALDRQPIPNADLIVLSEHVDYWNSLGWRDPFSSRAFSDRQHAYSERLGASVYTPQLVIDGLIQMVGSDQHEVMQAISRRVQEPKLPITVHATRSGNVGSIAVEANSGGAPADLYLVFAADHARSEVLKGENGGHTLTHVAVVKAIVKIGRWAGTTEMRREIAIPSKQFPPALLSGPPDETRVVAILQDPRSGRILGSAQGRI